MQGPGGDRAGSVLRPASSSPCPCLSGDSAGSVQEGRGLQLLRPSLHMSRNASHHGVAACVPMSTWTGILRMDYRRQPCHERATRTERRLVCTTAGHKRTTVKKQTHAPQRTDKITKRTEPFWRTVAQNFRIRFPL